MKEKPIRVLLADDHRVLREGLRVLLDDEEDISVIGEAGTGEEAICVALQTRPDIVIMDLGMPDMSGLDAIREIRRQDPQIRTVVLSMHSGREVVMQAIKAGCDGYVPKSSAHVNLLRAIRVVHSGQRYLHPMAATAVVDELTNRQANAGLLSVLSDREKEVLRLTAMGFTSREIGQKLVLSPKTVDTYRQRAMDKLNLEHRSDIIRFALRAGLLQDLAS
jgi:two-component system, NarL family, response regulator NreC